MGRNGKPLQRHRLSLLAIFFCCCIKFVSGISTREASEVRCIEQERRALLQFKQGLVDDYALLASWGNTSSSTSTDCCRWSGVGCSNNTGYVIMLDLHGYFSEELSLAISLSGEINSSLLELHHLRHLDLSFNSFTRIPEFIGSLKNLQYLNLSSIDFSIPKVPYQLGNLSSLQTLDLSGSSIILKNTDWLSHLSLLEYLDLRYVDLSESNNLLRNVINQLPSLHELLLENCLLHKARNSFLPMANLSKSLAILDISDNNLPASSIYPWLFNFSASLTDVDLSYNNLHGAIPEAFGAFKFLRNLDLTFNGLEGGIPSSFGNFSRLLTLHLGANNLKGDFPSVFRNLSGPTEKSIQVLELDANKLTGSLPDFTILSELRELYLQHNQLNGSFPEKFEQMSNLHILDLADNQISGLLPDLSALSSLKELYFEGNRVQGTLAERILPLSELIFLGASSNFLHGTLSEKHLTNLSHLVYLDLSFNSLAIEIDFDWSPTFQLDVISLSSCKLGPSFPKWLQTQNNFYALDVSGAGISDPVPSWFWEYLTPSLRYLNLSSNQIYGTIPDLMLGDKPIIDLSSNNFSGEVPVFPWNTQTLNLFNNSFTGSISSLCNLTAVVHLILSNNQLSGELPDCWMNLTNVVILNLENNKFTGRIPNSIGSLEFVDLLSMRGNSLTGELPSSLRHCTLLRLLDLGENKLYGNIPEWIGTRLTTLRVLSLPSNGFRGTMPSSICNLAEVHILDLSVNNLSGNIPNCLRKLTGMTGKQREPATIEYNAIGLDRTRLSIRSRYVFKALLQWKGKLSEYRNTLGLVISLDLSSNSFSGEIPGVITGLSGLVALNLSRNNFTGEIPQEIGRLSRLDFLDMSRNHLVGRIPASLAQLSNLGVLNLSSNNLSGRIPRSTQLQSFDPSSYAGNPELCGPPLPNACAGDQDPGVTAAGLEDEDEEADDKLITRGFYISLLIGLPIGFWGVCGTLVLKDSWRDAYFRFLIHLYDQIYVAIAVDLAGLWRWFRT